MRSNRGKTDTTAWRARDAWFGRTTGNALQIPYNHTIHTSYYSNTHNNNTNIFPVSILYRTSPTTHSRPHFGCVCFFLHEWFWLVSRGFFCIPRSQLQWSTYFRALDCCFISSFLIWFKLCFLSQPFFPERFYCGCMWAAVRMARVARTNTTNECATCEWQFQ